ncbi:MULTISPECIES: S8 family serine peptidase [Sphingobacterium]|uniref:Thermophilic serine proteinase n=2 Tax=Sphingobacterium TaxID=28453 RepID=A0A654BSE7_SPHMU|nr:MULTISPECIES: S8 family serine peptidase [Sphingobacterium]QQT43964.1 S8 family serine peptidase [Sphingobacterium multivorum]TWI23821.1 subtilase family protein [Sphingobacterium siyangense]SUJ07553.1 Thermophilic serine proteinase precursor [Sphingobacterium multivorum]VXC83173.1 Thermophilic serine proteinase [Sphingobacterium multivorum]
MNLRKSLYLLTLGALPLISFGQSDTIPANWFNLDYKTDGVMGISTEKTYKTLLKGRKSTPVIVGVLDGGVDVYHEDLKDVVWINVKDSLANGIDNDGNGYINDKYGWNFIGNADGKDVQFDNLELTRQLRVLDKKFANITAATELNETDRKAFASYQKMLAKYKNKLEEAKMGQFSYDALKRNIYAVVREIGKKPEDITQEDIDNFKATTNTQRIALAYAKDEINNGGFAKFFDDITEGAKYFNNQVDYHLNKAYDSRPIVGDNYEDASERYYGNADVKGPDALHGSHVAGIIGAKRNNNVGINGVADNVKILTVRLVPDGDERDKDVANAIRYAADNGAKVLNMSFGKSYAYNKQAVDDAIKYAESKDVLMVHAAGNDSEDNDIEPNFPMKYYTDVKGDTTGIANAWITVGATGLYLDNELLADFSNYGKKTVDVFAPGVHINSTVPDSKYKEEQGTSMAAPVVAGLAAMIRSYYPNLSAVETKQIIMESVEKPNQLVQVKVGEDASKTVRLADISVTGGIVNAYNAIIKAEEYTNRKKK